MSKRKRAAARWPDDLARDRLIGDREAQAWANYITKRITLTEYDRIVDRLHDEADRAAEAAPPDPPDQPV